MKDEIWNETIEQIELNQRKKDMERIERSTGVNHCPVCGTPIDRCSQCKKCGYHQD